MLKKLVLPLVEYLVQHYNFLNLKNVRIIGVQHILETTHSMFQSLYKLGLKSQNISIIGKCYSTSEEVFYEMLEDNIEVSHDSLAYNSHLSFDEIFNNKIKFFLLNCIEDLKSNDYEKIIVLDDGGKCINFLNDILPDNIKEKVVAIEQTSAGYREICKKQIYFPVINVARSSLKLEIESPMIAQAAIERLFLSLKKRKLMFNKALVLGGGPIGKAIQKELGKIIDICIYDIKNNGFHSDSFFINLIKKYYLIIGCTGITSIPYKFHKYLNPQTILVSVSSSDREFDAVFLRKYDKQNIDCHKDIYANNLFLVNSGFPVNFDGDRENIDPEKIQLTIALMTAGILQGCSNNLKKGINSLDINMEKIIKNQFFQLIPVNI